MEPVEIRIALLRAGYTQSRVARELGLHPNTVQTVVSGAGTSRRVAKRISEVTGIPISKLWPGRYSAPARRRAA
ncbi:MAG: helix-turn-helix domain-containing protein [Sinobacteraceae bacterium]|nr:helix-turn-helix domain-containing protein [Nevskiaceae bacterium]